MNYRDHLEVRTYIKMVLILKTDIVCELWYPKD